MTLNLRKVPAYLPGKVDGALTNLVHAAVDHVVPGLGKAEKAAAVYNIKQVVKKLGTYTEQGVKKIAKKTLGELGYLNYTPSSHLGMAITGRGTKQINMSRSTNAGGFALGGTTAAPVSISRNINRRSKPSIKMMGDAVVISHSEMLGAINSGTPSSNVTAFRCTGYRANPGMSTIFPWLSATAVNYEKYKFRRLSFTLVPLVSTNYSGRIGVGFDYDSSDLVPGNRQEFYALSNHCENMPWQESTVEIKCDNAYRFTGTHVAADNKLIDLGQVVVMSDSVSNGGTISAALPLFDLIVNYTVELIEPQQALFSSQLYSGSTTFTSGIPLGTGADTTTVVGPTVVNSTTVTNCVVTFKLPAGVFEVSYFIAWSTGTAAVVPTVPTTGAGSKLSNTSTGSNSYGVCFINSPVECDLLLTATVLLIIPTLPSSTCVFHAPARRCTTPMCHRLLTSLAG
ncbi:coat protein (p48) [Oat chlorotic stunt virus]|uniref:Capsid protein n=1 Tax=Oat chlorotic stunt virus (isolate United Kingdom) TaxID=652110 RepID=CAPSD_OCSVU|nr:coat protein (p48) [Oat chlorotic stunt virus]Q83928.1 RecName: Full=Capsid protein; AltName: Full=p48 [Oat chlorotic stunt virus isolate United Kingdom]CAA58798.1 coat protein (p48) [Oat chlorotic stunt virus]